ncbi:hypothetical protein QIU18_13995 [Capnocytophaga canimorsus]|nr:hypothetical protein [Capnocytophaga canimorsus]WGU68412.1 hypothetical protein QIU19_14605 [Capnocytophaga canimorsus]WGU70482.1 hypothetical protein QIU18_13995 [Capnocytophaga canimorsus]
MIIKKIVVLRLHFLISKGRKYGKKPKKYRNLKKAFGKAENQFVAEILNIKPWTAETPNLYDLQLILKDKKRTNSRGNPAKNRFPFG